MGNERKSETEGEKRERETETPSYLQSNVPVGRSTAVARLHLEERPTADR